MQKLRVVPSSSKVRRAEQEYQAARDKLSDLRKQVELQKKEVIESAKRMRDAHHASKLKGRKVDSEASLVQNLTLFERKPSVTLAARQLEIANRLDEWDGLSLLGLYLEQYEKLHGQEWKGSPVGLRRLFMESKQLYSRHGDDAAEAIVAVFSPKMAWAENKMGLLLSVDGYPRFIVPAMTAVRNERRHSGEQAEWSLGRTAESSCEEIEL